MAKKVQLNKKSVIEKLEILGYKADKEEESDALMENVSMTKSILKLADINHEKEYLLCFSVAKKILGKIPGLDGDLNE